MRRLIDEVMNGGRLDVLAEVYSPDTVAAARRWIRPFREAFPDVRMEIVTLVADGDTVAGRFRCSATHLGRGRGHEPTGRTFRNVDEVYFSPSARVTSPAPGGSRTTTGDAASWGCEDGRSPMCAC